MYLVFVDAQSQQPPSGPRFLDSYLPYQLRRADQVVSEGFYETLNRHEIARSEWRVLAVLFDLGELSMLELTAASLSPQPTVTHAVRRLETRGMVRRSAGTQDRRQRFVAITPTGHALAAALVREAKDLEREALDQVGDSTALIDELRRLASLIEAADTKPITPDRTDSVT